MQDKYAGDVGDFGKFILLNELLKVSGRQLRLGVNWYRVTRPEKSNNDGRHVSYLDPKNTNAARFQTCAPGIYSKLRSLVEANNRSIRALERSMILPQDTIFFSTPLPYGSKELAKRIIERDNWYLESADKLRFADVLFLDPDNGIQTERVRKTQTRSIKYALVDEVCGFARVCDLLVLYNHRDHTPIEQYLQKFTTVHKQLGQSTGLRILHFKKISARDYAFFFKRRAAPVVRSLFNRLTPTPFDFLFEELSLD
jgi:hypothetical protein